MILLLLPAIPLLLQVTPPPAATQPAQPPPAAQQPAPQGGRVVHLDDAVQAAIKHQPAVLQAMASTEAAAGRSDQARSGFFPQLTGTAIYQRRGGTSGAVGTVPSTSGSASTVAPPTSGGSYDYWSFGVNATQLLWDFNQTYNRLRAADRAVESLKAGQKTAELTVLLNVRRAYFAARAQKALIKVAEETLANEERHMIQIAGFVKAGTHPEIDVVQEKTTLANDRVSLINAQNNYEIAKSQLNQAMGLVGDTAFDVADEELPTIDGEDLPSESLVQKALGARPEIAALERQREFNELTVKSIKGAYGPTLNATAGASAVGTALDNLGSSWSIGANLTWPFFQGGLTRGQVREAQANMGVTSAQLESEKLQVRFDVEQAVLTVRAAKASIGAANEALGSAREQLRLAEGRYEAGVGSIIELGDAQVTVTNAAAQVVQAQFNLATARAQLLTAMGRT
jgi:outer membrane protein